MSASNWRCLGSLANTGLLARVFTAWKCNGQTENPRKEALETKSSYVKQQRMQELTESRKNFYCKLLLLEASEEFENPQFVGHWQVNIKALGIQ